MRKNKILRINEFRDYQEMVNHCHLTEVISEDIKLTKHRKPIYECGDSVGQSESSIIILPTSVKKTERNVARISRIIEEYADMHIKREECRYSVGHYFAGDYTSDDDTTYTSDSLCVSLSDGLGDIPTVVEIGAKLMRGFRLSRILIVNPNTIMEVGMDGQVKKEGRQISRIND